MKKILILGGGQAQINLIKAAKEDGLYVIVVGISGNYPGYRFADKIYDADIFDKNAVLDIAIKEKIDGISMVCSDFGLETVGFVNDRLHLNGISEESAIAAANKLEMKRLLTNNDIKTAKFAIVSSDEDAVSKIEGLNYPLITKAVDLQGSRGIYICRDEKELFVNYKKSIEESGKNYCIVEEFIEGKEFGAQAFVSDGEVLFVLFHDDELLQRGDTNIPVGHFVPYMNKNDSRMTHLSDMVKKAIGALGFRNGAVNIDLIEKDGAYYIIELTGRAGANSLPEIISAYYGFNYYKMILNSALGESLLEYQAKLSNHFDGFILSRQLYSEESGVLESIQFEMTEGVLLVDLFKIEGETIHAFTNSADSIGRVIVCGKTEEECHECLNLFCRNLTLKVS